MNIVKISDGLGNQMFQYAFARKLQIDTGRTVCLDIRYINNEDRDARKENNYYTDRNDFRQYGLDNFRIRLPVADEKHLRNWNYLHQKGKVHQGIYTMAKNGLWPFGYCDEDMNGVKTNTNLPMYYKGYFFHLKYFDAIKEELKKEFVLKHKLKLPAELREILSDNNTVSVHVRRGDFLKLNRDISRKDYYPRALQMIEAKVENPIYLFFSDDIAWVKENIRTKGKAVYISDMGFRDYEELAIMKHCKYNIIANSTFSYWAAYLNLHPDKIVICPRHWKSNIIPKDWVCL